jgi:hypothetical protein
VSSTYTISARRAIRPVIDGEDRREVARRRLRDRDRIEHVAIVGPTTPEGVG